MDSAAKGTKQVGHHTWKQAAYMHSSGITIRQWSILNNVCYFNIRQHILDGMSPDEACSYAQARTGKHDTKNKYYVDGVNLKEYCRRKKMAYSTVLKRILKGISVEKAVRM